MHELVLLLPCYCETPSQPSLFMIFLSPSINLTFPSPLVSPAFGSVLSSLQGCSDNREEAKRPARRTQLGKGDIFITLCALLDVSCSKDFTAHLFTNEKLHVHIRLVWKSIGLESQVIRRSSSVFLNRTEQSCWEPE